MTGTCKENIRPLSLLGAEKITFSLEVADRRTDICNNGVAAHISAGLKTNLLCMTSFKYP